VPSLNLSDVMSALSYDGDSGRLAWKISRGKARPGQLAGSVDKDGYLQVVVLGMPVKAHRLAWFMHHGSWPDGEIDHINGLRADNRIANLRVVSRGENCRNLHKTPANGVGIRGAVRQVTGRFGARVKLDGRTYWLGTFDTPQEAGAVYAEGRRCKTREELIGIRAEYRQRLKQLKESRK
jgi:hypothetical protein